MYTWTLGYNFEARARQHEVAWSKIRKPLGLRLDRGTNNYIQHDFKSGNAQPHYVLMKEAIVT